MAGSQAARPGWSRGRALDPEVASGPVTSILPSAKRPGRLEIAVARGRPVVVEGATVDRLGLTVGAEVTPAVALTIVDEALELRAYDRAVAMLTARPRAASDLRRLLVRKGERPAHAERAVARLSEQGFVDDARFARQYARVKAVGAGTSRRRIQRELARLGVARDVADAAVAEVFHDEEIDEAAALDRLVRKKLRTVARLDDASKRRRLYGFLARRGYDNGAIIAAMRRLAISDADPAD